MRYLATRDDRGLIYLADRFDILEQRR